MAVDEVTLLLNPLSANPSSAGGRRTRYAAVHTALGRIGGAERQFVRFVEASRSVGVTVDVYYNGPSFPELERLGNLFPKLPGSTGPATIRSYLLLVRRLRAYDSIIIYHHVEPLLLGLISGLLGERCVAYLGEPLRPLWEHEVSGDRSLISYPEMRRTAAQLYGPFLAHLLDHPTAMAGIVRLLRTWDRLSHRHLPQIVANSRWMAGIIRRVYRLSTAPAVVYQGVPLDFGRAELPPDDGVVLSVGAFIPLKDHATLLRSWAEVEMRLGSRCPELVLIGNGPTRDATVGLARTLGLRRVAFVAHVSEEGLSKWYRRARLLVHTAIGEPFGMTPVEAAAHHVPSVVSEGGGAAEFVIDGACGRTFPARDEHRLAATLIQLLSDPAELDRLGVAAFARQRSGFTIGHTVAGLLVRLSGRGDSRPAEDSVGVAFDASRPSLAR